MLCLRKVLVLLFAAALVTTGVFGGASPASATPTDSGYWMLTSEGHVYACGGAAMLGSTVSWVNPQDIEATPSGDGYWVLSEFGLVYPYGDAGDFGDPYSKGGPRPGAGLATDEYYVSMSATRTGLGYWLFTNKGRVAAFGDAVSFGDMSGKALNGQVLDSVATATGKGYWMVASDGGLFSFGDASFHGSMGGVRLNKPVMSMAPDPDGVGYWLVASDGGIFAFQAPFLGSMGQTRLNKPISGIVGGPNGYLMVAEDGGIFTFGNVEFHGSLGSTPPSSPVVAVAVISDPPGSSGTTIGCTKAPVSPSTGTRQTTSTNNFYCELISAVDCSRQTLHLMGELEYVTASRQDGNNVVHQLATGVDWAADDVCAYSQIGMSNTQFKTVGTKVLSASGATLKFEDGTSTYDSACYDSSGSGGSGGTSGGTGSGSGGSSGGSSGGRCYVNSYYRKDGTYVSGYWRSC